MRDIYFHFSKGKVAQMQDLLIIIGIVVVGFFISIITSLEDYFNSERNGVRRITKKGWVFLVVALITIALYIIQFHLNEKEIAKREKAFENKLDANKEKIIETFTDGLAKYGLKYDSSRRRIEKLIKDSAQRKTVIINKSEPFLSLCQDRPIHLENITQTNYKFVLHICNSSAPSRNIDAIVYVVSVDSLNRLYFTKELDLFQSKAQLDKNAHIEQQLLVPNLRKYRICYFLIKGSWTNVSEKNKYEIDEIYHYNLETGNSGGITSSHERQIRLFLKDKLNK